MIEVLKQALEVIETAIKAGDWKVDGACDPDNVIHGLRQAIREHAMYEVQRLGQEIEQEPVADHFAGAGKMMPVAIDALVKEEMSHYYDGHYVDSSDAKNQLLSFAHRVAKLYNHPPQRTEQNFCPRCGKRTNDIHTCTPPQEKNRVKT
jgi:hypothetical protein